MRERWRGGGPYKMRLFIQVCTLLIFNPRNVILCFRQKTLTPYRNRPVLVELGRPRDNRVCKIRSKNKIGDEFHYLFICKIQLYPNQECHTYHCTFIEIPMFINLNNY